MPREYRHIKEYEKEILEMRENGYTRREIAEKFGMTKEQIKGFISRYTRNQRKMEAGIALKKKADRQRITLSANKTRSQN